MAVKFGKFILLNKIATGGMAEVFRAKHIGVGGFEKIVAIKRILPHFSHNEEFITMFNEEAKVSAQLSHQNIVQIYEFGMVEDSYYIAMEYVDGINLNDLLITYVEMDQVIPTWVTLAIIRDACKGLDYAHRKKGFDNKPLNIVHRDISPKNIMISFDGSVKVMDFGIAKAASRDYETRTGVIKGKISYLSPEQVQGARLDRRSDIFSLGIVFYEMLTGTKCFKGESDFSILFKIKNAEIDLVTDINPSVPADVSSIVLKALAQNKDERYQVCEDLATDIERCLANQKVDPSETNIANFMRVIEVDFRPKMGDLSEYFPEQGEDFSGEVFQLDANGQIPESIGTKIVEESISREIGAPSPGTRVVDPGTKVVEPPTPPKAEMKKKSSWRAVLAGLSILVLIAAGSAFIFRDKIPWLASRGGTESPTPGIPGESETPKVPGRAIKYSIPLSTIPDRATVSVNGSEKTTLTPFTLEGEGRENETLVLLITKDCFNPHTENIILTKGRIPEEVKVPLVRRIIKVILASEPPGAEAFIDDKKAGVTPLTVNDVDTCASHSLKLVKSDYESLSRSNLQFKEEKISFSLVKQQIPGQVRITSNYQVTILLGSKTLGEVGSGGATFNLPAGQSSLTALNPGYCIRHKFGVTVEPRKTAAVSLSFGALGNVFINSNPYSKVTVNDFPLGDTPITKLDLPEGSYEVLWDFVTLGKKKNEKLKIKPSIRQRWEGTP